MHGADAHGPIERCRRRGAAAQGQLHSLLAAGESVWIADPPHHAGLQLEQELDCVQMVLPSEVPVPAPGAAIVALSGADAPEMVALTKVAFPGFFRAATYKMGTYVGVRVDGQLVAMAGERLRPGSNRRSG